MILTDKQAQGVREVLVMFESDLASVGILPRDIEKILKKDQEDKTLSPGDFVIPDETLALFKKIRERGRSIGRIQ